RGGMTLRANRLIAVAAEDGSLDSAWTEAGPVTVVEGNRQARSGRAHFLGNGQRLVLTGQPKLTEGDTFLEGDRVIFHVGQDRVGVDKPRAAFPLERAAGRSGKRAPCSRPSFPCSGPRAWSRPFGVVAWSTT